MIISSNKWMESKQFRFNLCCMLKQLRFIDPASNRLSSYVAMETLSRLDSDSNIDLKRSFFEILDLILNYMNGKFFYVIAFLPQQLIKSIILNSILSVYEEKQALLNLNIELLSQEEVLVISHYFRENNIEKKDYFLKLYFVF